MIPMIPDVVRAFGLAALQAAGLLALAPLLKTAIKKMKARLQNRQGPPLLQGYYDLAKSARVLRCGGGGNDARAGADGRGAA